jgi:hypothetical protein
MDRFGSVDKNGANRLFSSLISSLSAGRLEFMFRIKLRERCTSWSSLIGSKGRISIGFGKENFIPELMDDSVRVSDQSARLQTLTSNG